MRKYLHLSLKQHLLILVTAVFAVITLFPFAIMVLYTGKSYPQIISSLWAFPDPVQWDYYLFGLRVTGKYILNSIIISVGVLVLTFVFAALASYAFSRLNFFGRKLTHSAVITLLFVPGTLTIVPLFLTVRDVGLLNTYWGMILPQVAGAIPMSIFLLKAFFDEIPEDLYNAAKIDGAGNIQTLWHIVVPLSIPVFSTLSVLNVLGSWNNYIWALICIKDADLRTIPLGLMFVKVEEYLQFEPGKLMAAYFIASLPMLIVFLIAMKPFMKGMTAGAIKS